MLDMFVRSDGEITLKLVLILDLVLVVIGVIAYLTDSGELGLLLMICVPWFALMTLVCGVKALIRAASGHEREVEPFDAYYSIQHRAKEFMHLETPSDAKNFSHSFANQCIKDYAKKGKINLSEEERTRLSIELLDTGISSKTPNYEKSYYERERVALLENLLSEKND